MSLEGKRIILTRPKRDAGELSRKLRQSGATVTCIPTIDIAPLPLSAETSDVVKDLNAFHGGVFTSKNAIRFFFKAMRKQFGDAWFANVNWRAISWACVGPSTAKLLSRYLGVTALFPQSSKGVASLLPLLVSEWLPQGSKVLCPTAKEAGFELKEGLERAGLQPLRLACYETRPLKVAGDLGDPADAIVFMSPSAANSFRDSLKDHPGLPQFKENLVVSIGPSTTEALKSLGFKDIRETTGASSKAVVECLSKLWYT